MTVARKHHSETCVLVDRAGGNRLLRTPPVRASLSLVHNSIPWVVVKNADSQVLSPETLRHLTWVRPGYPQILPSDQVFLGQVACRSYLEKHCSKYVSSHQLYTFPFFVPLCAWIVCLMINCIPKVSFGDSCLKLKDITSFRKVGRFLSQHI